MKKKNKKKYLKDDYMYLKIELLLYIIIAVCCMLIVIYSIINYYLKIA